MMSIFELIVQSQKKTLVIWVCVHNYKQAIYHTNIGAQFRGGGLTELALST